MAITLAQLERRLNKIEGELRELKAPQTTAEEQSPWYDQIVGLFDDDPGFDDMVRRGKEIREQDRAPRPKQTRRASSRKGSR